MTARQPRARKPKGRKVWVLQHIEDGTVFSQFDTTKQDARCSRDFLAHPRGWRIVPATLTLHEKGKKRHG